MKILISSHHKDVFLHLCYQNEKIDEVYSMGFSFAESLYYKLLFRSKGVFYHSIDVSNERFFERDRVIDYPTEYKFFKESIEYFRSSFEKREMLRLLKIQKLVEERASQVIKDQGIECVVTWNGLNYLDKAVVRAAEKWGVPVVFYEMGYFRPNSMTIDAKGVNFLNSLPRSIEFYIDWYSNNRDTIESSGSTSCERINYNYSCWNGAYKIYKVFDHISAYLNFKNFKLYRNTNSKRVASKNIIAEVKERDSIMEAANIYDRVFFFPMQVVSDTQLQIYYKGDERQRDLLNYFIKEVSVLDSLIGGRSLLVVKPHPLGKYSDINFVSEVYDSVFFCHYLSSHELIKLSDFVLTVNSTVGLEAIALKRPVFSFGDAFYNIEGVSRKVDEFKESLSEIIINGDYQVDFDAQAAFIAYMRSVYQCAVNPDNIMNFPTDGHHSIFNNMCYK